MTTDAPELTLEGETSPEHSTDKNPMVRKHGLGPDGARCKTCALFKISRPGANRYFKCRLRGITHGAATDHRANYRACAKFEARKETK